MNKFIIGTFYTKETPYEDVFNKFFLQSVMQSALKDNIEWKVVAVDNQGSWIKNVAQKPKVILEILNTMLEVGDTRALVFLDADSTIENFPILFNELSENVDVALHYLDWQSWYRNGINRKELLTGTMFFRNNERVRDLVQEWYDQAIKTDLWEQQVLEKIIIRKNLTIYEIPVEYCYIKTLPNGNKPHVICDNPVIVHHQVSRTLKRIIN